jgi:hypothetical protein
MQIKPLRMDGVTRQKQIVEEPNKTRKDKASFVETPQENSTQIFKWFGQILRRRWEIFYHNLHFIKRAEKEYPEAVHYAYP